MKKSRCLLKKDDKVKVITGKDIGKIGKILKVDRKKSRVLVEKINIVHRHTKNNPTTKQGGIIEKEAPISWSNVMLMCNKCLAPVRVKMKTLEDGKKIRVCRKCDEIVDS